MEEMAETGLERRDIFQMEFWGGFSDKVTIGGSRL